MPDVSATDAARHFSNLLDAIEHRGEQFVVVRRGRRIARLQPVPHGAGSDVKAALRRHTADPGWSADLTAMRDVIRIDDRR